MAGAARHEHVHAASKTEALPRINSFLQKPDGGVVRVFQFHVELLTLPHSKSSEVWSADRRKIERMRNAETELRQLIGMTSIVIMETQSLIRELDAMDHPVIDRKDLKN